MSEKRLKEIHAELLKIISAKNSTLMLSNSIYYREGLGYEISLDTNRCLNQNYAHLKYSKEVEIRNLADEAEKLVREYIKEQKPFLYFNLRIFELLNPKQEFDVLYNNEQLTLSSASQRFITFFQNMPFAIIGYPALSDKKTEKILWKMSQCIAENIDSFDLLGDVGIYRFHYLLENANTKKCIKQLVNLLQNEEIQYLRETFPEILEPTLS